MTTSALDEHDAGARLGGFGPHLEAQGREDMATSRPLVVRGAGR